MGKGVIFSNLLHSYGISEYWCDPLFNPDLEHPNGDILLPVTDSSLGEMVADLYNDYNNDENSMTRVRQAEPNTKLFNMIIERMERRVI